MAPAAPSSEGDGRPAAPARPRWLWFPPAWIGLLAGLCGYLRWRFEDRGVYNTAVVIAAGLAAIGVAVWIARRSGWPTGVRRTTALVLIALTAAFYLQLLPVELVNDGDAGVVGWRWRGNDPDRALTGPLARAAAPRAIDWRESATDFPRFLGGGYWAEAGHVQLDPDWKARPPKLLWRQPIGAGWSGFAVVGDYAVTQEQRGDEELVVCYHVPTGDVAWSHADAVRWDPRASGSLGGVGPRATPTLFQGRVVTMGATGLVNCLDARTGKLQWRHDTLAEFHAANVMWGKACSPLVVDELAVVSVGGSDGGSLVAYRLADGRLAWHGGDRQSSYASPILAELDGVRQIVCVNQDFVTAHDPSDGAVLWEHPWPGNSDSNASTTQPIPVADDRLFLSRGYGHGAELVAVKRDRQGAWTVASLWKKPAVMRTKMSNPVVRDGHVYGLSDGLLQCIELDTGRSRWKKRRSPSINHGQLLLVGELLLAVTERGGEAVLIRPNPARYEELTSFDAIGCDTCINWNTPALSGRRLLLRNDQQAACYELPLLGEGRAPAERDTSEAAEGREEL